MAQGDYRNHTIHPNDQLRELLHEALSALELCLEHEQLTWEAEQAADLVLRRAQDWMASHG